MPVFAYVAKGRDGREIRDYVTSDSRYSALSDLKDEGLTVLELTENSAHTQHASPNPPPVPRKKKTLPTAGRVSLSEKAMFCRQLSVSVSAGVPLRDALESITEDMEHPGLKRVLESTVQGLHDGKTFSEAIAPHKGVFNTLFISLIKSAEESGSMPKTLEDLANSMEKTERLVRKVRSVTAYPTFVAVFFSIIVAIMTLFVLPQFQRNFESFGAQLPVLTRAVFKVNTLIVSYFPYIMIVLFLLVASFVLYSRTQGGRMRIDGLKLKLPMFGMWLRKFAVARFCRNLAMMIRGGVSITTAIEIASSTSGNRVMEVALLAARDTIMNGASLTASLAQQGVFPKLVLRMINVGESSGRLPDVLEKVSDAYEEEVEGSIMTATTLFEPMAICFFGAVILVLVLAIYIPVFTVASKMK
jgi:type IV pilus assembly protein PilC